MKKIVSIFTFLSFIFTGQMGTYPVYAQDFILPAPGVMVHLSPEFNPPILKGIKVHPDNPFRFDFILDKGDGELNNDQLKQESSKLIKYFLASLTIPEKDLWVNLSPYEKDRIIPNSFGLTEMGRDLLAEDYMLKQITASLIYPEDEIGMKFWKRIYEEAEKRYGTTNIPVNTFNKVWIVPEKAVVFENAKAGTAYVVESKLKVMLEQDYLSLAKHEGIQSEQTQSKDTNQLGSQIVREIVIPELTTEVNVNKNFARLRQVYNSLILATWYKKKIKDSILEQVYADKNKVVGVNVDDPQEKERIYQQYLKAFKKGAYNYIKEDVNPVTQETIPRKYFSGGEFLDLDDTNLAMAHLEIINRFTDTAMFSNDRAMIIESRLNRAEKATITPATAPLRVYGSQKVGNQAMMAPNFSNKRASKTMGAVSVMRRYLNSLGLLNDELSIDFVITPMYKILSFLFRFDAARPNIIKKYEDTIAPGSIGWILARSIYFDNLLGKKLKYFKKQGVKANIVELGAGLSPRAYRFHKEIVDAGAQFFEIDQPASQKIKLDLLKNARAKRGEGVYPSSSIHYVPVNFEIENFWEKLKATPGFRPSSPTIFIWEGVTMYLPEEAVVSTLAMVRNNAAPGSVITFDYTVPPEQLGNTYGGAQWKDIVEKLGEEARWGSDPQTLAGQLTAMGYRVTDNSDNDYLKNDMEQHILKDYKGPKLTIAGFVNIMTAEVTDRPISAAMRSENEETGISRREFITWATKAAIGIGIGLGISVPETSSAKQLHSFSVPVPYDDGNIRAQMQERIDLMNKNGYISVKSPSDILSPIKEYLQNNRRKSLYLIKALKSINEFEANDDIPPVNYLRELFVLAGAKAALEALDNLTGFYTTGKMDKESTSVFFHGVDGVDGPFSIWSSYVNDENFSKDNNVVIAIYNFEVDVDKTASKLYPMLEKIKPKGIYDHSFGAVLLRRVRGPGTSIPLSRDSGRPPALETA